MRAPDTAPDVSRRAPPAPPSRARPVGALRRTARALVTLVVAGAVLALAALTATRWLDAAVPPVLPAVQAVVPLLAVPVTLVLVVALIARRRWTAAAAAALAAVHLALAAPWWLPAPTAPPSVPGDRLTVVAGNVQQEFGDPGDLARAALARDADVLAVVEAVPATLAGLEAAGVREELPYLAGRTGQESEGVLLLSRHPISTAAVPPTPDIRYALPAAVVAAPAGDVLVAAIHPVSPVPEDAAEWHREVTALTAWAETVPTDIPLVLAGDFNATADHPVFRRFGGAGLIDVHRQLGGGRPRTWPANQPDVPPLFDLDHVLARGFVTVDGGTVTVDGSDHRAVWAELVPTG